MGSTSGVKTRQGPSSGVVMGLIKLGGSLVLIVMEKPSAMTGAGLYECACCAG